MGETLLQLALIIIPSAFSWWLGRKKTATENRKESADATSIEIANLKEIIESLREEVKRCQSEIAQLRTEQRITQRAVAFAYGCPNIANCPVVKQINENNS